MPNQLKRDPTRTVMLRRRFVADMTRRFKKLSKEIQKLVVDEDVFGLDASNIGGIEILQERQAWRFRSNAQKIIAYQQWLVQQVNSGILTTIGGIANKPWTSQYVESAYLKGGVRAYTDLRAEELANDLTLFRGGQAEFLRSSFSGPLATQQLELISTRAFTELKGVTDAMSQQMSRVLANGLAQGFGTKKIARELRKNVSNITKTRASVLARTEVIAAYSEGQLDAFVLLGETEVGVMAEWLTAGDNVVCPLCAELEGVVMTIEEARGLIPRHPRCRCAWIPAERARKEKGQLRGREKNKAIKDSIGKEAPKTIKRSFREVKKRSVWRGKELI